MKKRLLTLCIAVAAAFSAAAASDDDFAVPFEQIPAASRTFVTTHFASVQVAYCLRDSHSFEVRLADGAEIEFFIDGSWKEIDCKYKALPDGVTALLPKTILPYVKANFPTSIITKVGKKFWGFEIELNNGLDLEFSTEGQFLRIDD